MDKFNLDKKKIIIAAVALFVFFGLVATCVSSGSSSSKDSEPVMIKPDQTKVKGDLKDCFEVVDKAYEVKFDRGEKIASVFLFLLTGGKRLCIMNT